MSKIQTYLLKHPIDRTQRDPYGEAAKALKLDREAIRSAWKALRQKGAVEQDFSPSPTISISPEWITTSTTDSYTIKTESKKEIRNEADLVEECNIDLKEWSITGWECKRYNAWIKNKAGEIESQPKYSVYAKMKRREMDTDPQKQKEVILKELMDSAPELVVLPIHDVTYNESTKRDTLYELSLPDIHFGKLAWRDETGEDYDLKIACKRYNDAIYDLLERVNLDKVERILFPIGNDMINIDNNNNTTTAGTPQHVDVRFPKIIRIVKELLIENITTLAAIAPVDVLVVPGNHDNHTMFMIGEILEAYFAKTQEVTVLNAPKPRKYYQYGNCAFQYTHGNEEKHTDLGLIFATEEPKIWAASTHRVCKLGHYHKTKKLSYVSTDEHQGFQVEVLPSLSGTDLWHKKKGYMSAKAAKAFLYHKTKGKVAEFTYSL
jgi:hypothetical protein